ncbi:hypothetical protein S40288_08582 [Stachybotrys chartarum IBT 40288]|nr:hypothetical protein S40288_08582 [Stachybotrys chartarum IBT 40288]
MDPAGTRQTPQGPAESASPTIAPEVLEVINAPRAPDAPRRCFICLTDQEPSDDPSTWVDPCPCTLEAHQDCMLSWVTDCERSNKPLKCPVCKYQIELAGPWDPIVAVSEAVERRFTRASPFLLATGLSISVQFSLQLYGALALWSFAGRDALLSYVLGPTLVIDGRARGGLGFARERITSTLQLMSVGPVLLLGQLLPSLGNKIFLPTASFYGIYHIMHDDHFLAWPPSPQLAMAVFPFVRSTYYNLWREFALPYEIRFNRQIQGLPPLEPRAADNGAARNPHGGNRAGDGGLMGLLQSLVDALDPEDERDGGDAGNGIRIVREDVEAANNAQDGGLLVELIIENVNEDDFSDEEDDDIVPIDVNVGLEDPPGPVEPAIDPDVERLAAEPPAGGPPAEPQANEEPPAAPANQEQQQQPPQPQQQPPAAGHEAPRAPPARRPGLGGILSSISNALVSSLILPGVSFAMGEALRLALPRSWTETHRVGQWYRGTAGRPGLLQQQWGRSLIGGCMFVVIRDAVRLWAKYRRVVAMENRQVKNVKRRRTGR